MFKYQISHLNTGEISTLSIIFHCELSYVLLSSILTYVFKMSMTISLMYHSILISIFEIKQIS